MPPRYAYWTIIADGLPTAFRAAEKDELLPTFSRIKHKHPDAEMKWFARGKLWDSPESARREQERPARPREWRPGGDHRDPRQPFKDAKKARNLAQRKSKFQRRHRGGAEAFGGRSAEGTRSSPRPPRAAGKREWRGPRSFQNKSFARNQQPNEPTAPPEETRREPRPREGTKPTPPPRPSEPVIPPPGPPERGRRFPPRKRRQ